MPEQISSQTNQEQALTAGEAQVERCLTFESGGLLLFISTKYVIEIITGHSITPIPRVPTFVKGVINLRGQIMPVVDIRLYMDKPQLEYTEATCIIVLNIGSILLGIVVDSVKQVIDIDLRNIQPIPMKRRQKLLDGMITMEDGSVLMAFDCEALANSQY